MKPGNVRPRGGELAADDCWLDGYHAEREERVSYGSFVGEVAPEVRCGEATAEYPLGDPLVDIIFGVPVGVSRGVIYAVMENRFPAFLDAVDQKLAMMNKPITSRNRTLFNETTKCHDIY